MAHFIEIALPIWKGLANEIFDLWIFYLNFIFVKIITIRTPKIFAVITLKFKQGDFTIE